MLGFCGQAQGVKNITVGVGGLGFRGVVNRVWGFKGFALGYKVYFILHPSEAVSTRKYEEMAGTFRSHGCRYYFTSPQVKY